MTKLIALTISSIYRRRFMAFKLNYNRDALILIITPRNTASSAVILAAARRTQFSAAHSNQKSSWSARRS